MSRIATTFLASLIILSATSAAGRDLDESQQPASPSGQADANSMATSPKRARPRMDVVFAIDATSSMGDEIDVIKKEVWAIANRLVTGKPSPDVRFGLVLYRDTTESQLVEITELTRDVDQIHGKLMAARVIGGGDKPEHVGKGLHAGLDLAWDRDPSVKRTIYLVGDAGANQHAGFTVGDALLRAKEMKIAINTIGCSGLTSSEREEFTAIAASTGGSFDALTYHAVVAGEDGKKKSVVYYDGEIYETDGVLAEEEWKQGGAEVIAKRKMKKAAPTTRARAGRATKVNNLDRVVESEMKLDAAAMGVDY